MYQWFQQPSSTPTTSSSPPVHAAQQQRAAPAPIVESTAVPSTSVQDPSHAIEIDDYAGLTLPASSPFSSTFGAPPSSSSSTSTASTSFAQPSYSSHPNFFYNTSSPFNTIAYGSSAWPLPISSFSTLNGANPAAAIPSSSQTPQQVQSPPQNSQRAPTPSHATPMVIDPSLTTTNGTNTTTTQYSPPSMTNISSGSNLSSSTSQIHQRNPYIQAFLPNALSITNAYLQYAQQLQNYNQSQGTLSPQALQASSNPTTSLSSLPLGTFYAASPPFVSLGIRFHIIIDDTNPALKPLLVSTAFNGAGAVNTMVNRIEDYGYNAVDAVIRLEILTKIRDGAGNHYFRAWAENGAAMDITREWLKAAFVAKQDDPLVETVMPLLHLIDRLPLTLELLKSSKLGKIIVKLVKDPPSPAIKDMASNIERRWRSLLSSQDNGSKSSDPVKAEDSKTKKRKLSEPPSSKGVPPQKKAATGAGSSAKATVKKEPKPTSIPVKDAKSDSSFFSAPKPKPKLPSFKKAPPPPANVKKEPDLNVAQPSSIDPFQEALKSMAKGRKDSPIQTPPPAASTPSSDTPVPSVSSKPTAFELPEAIAAIVPERGSTSEERHTQEQREQTALSAVYLSPQHIPDTPGEPSQVYSEEEIYKDTKQMTCGPEADAYFWQPDLAAQQPLDTNSTDANMNMNPTDVLNGLLGQISAGGGMMDYSQSVSENGSDASASASGTQLNFDQIAAIASQMPQLQSLLLQLGNNQPPQASSQQDQQPYAEQTQAWGNYSEYGQQGYHNNDGARDWSDRGRGGRGRGRMSIW
ncbi:hypothetical protein ONZ45_g7623 [Pleurotus djamor]|nr:hypothetical protein ONZ45_g7623 [Pleurotus djamor]